MTVELIRLRTEAEAHRLQMMLKRARFDTLHATCRMLVKYIENKGMTVPPVEIPEWEEVEEKAFERHERRDWRS